MTTSSLGHIPLGKWQFDESVASCFEDMLERSIPQYQVMRNATFTIACRYAQRDTTIVDLGCSLGSAMAKLVEHFGVQNRYVGVEISQPMLQAARERFKGYIQTKVVDIRELDLRRDYPAENASVTLSILVLQFIPVEYRQRLVRKVWQHTLPGGAFVLVEKILGATADLDQFMVDCYYDLKRTNGYDQEEIERKRLSLEGVLVPLTAKGNTELLKQAGFSQIDCFWRWMNFAGWVAVK